jgi:hypothetical protein
MGAMVLRELRVIGRRGALSAAMCVHVALLTGYLLAWGNGNGIPVAGALTVYDQTLMVDVILLAILLPWIAARCVAAERGDDLVMLSMVTAIPPSRVVVARALAATTSLILVIASGLPTLILAGRISAVRMSLVAEYELALFSLAFVSSATALTWRHVCHSRVIGWFAAALSTAAVVSAARMAPSLVIAPVLTAAALCAMGLLALRADVSLRYLAERSE